MEHALIIKYYIVVVGLPMVKFNQNHIYWARRTCEIYGSTVEQLAKYFGVSLSTLRGWMREHPELKEAVREGRYTFDNEHVEKALLQRALGYEFTETTREPVVVIQGGEKTLVDRKMRVTKKVKKHLPPDTGAAKHWLNNRDPEKWKDKSEVEHGVTGALEDALTKANRRLERIEKNVRGIERRSEVEMEPGSGEKQEPDVQGSSER